MDSLNRKGFLKNLGLIGAGSMLMGAVPTSGSSTNNPANTEPKRAQNQKPSLRVAHLTDIHIKPERVAEYGMAASLNSVNGLSTKVDFILNGGDAIMNAASLAKSAVKAQWKAFHQILESDNSLPLYHCVGNHDLYGWMLPSPTHTDGKQWCMDEYQLTKTYYSFIQNNWKFIVLDSVHSRNSVPGYYGKLDSEQLNWLKNELETTPDTIHICIVSHIPILSICSLFDKDITNTGKRSISETNMHTDSEVLIDLFYKHPNVRACVSGHIHLIDYLNYLGVDYYCNGAVSGHWWKGSHQYFNPSYSVMNFYEDGGTSREVVYYNWKS